MEMNINIEYCNGQCFHNASNMSGVYKGVQSCMCEVSSLAGWVPCAAHTLKLAVGTVALRLMSFSQLREFIADLHDQF